MIIFSFYLFRKDYPNSRAITDSGYYATPDDPENWNELGAFGNYFDFNTVGLGVLNTFYEEVDTETAFIGLYEWFEISQP